MQPQYALQCAKWGSERAGHDGEQRQSRRRQRRNSPSLGRLPRWLPHLPPQLAIAAAADGGAGRLGQLPAGWPGALACRRTPQSDCSMSQGVIKAARRPCRACQSQ